MTLTATEDPGSSTFEGWSGGGCSGTNPCTVTLNTDTIVTATFSLISIPVSTLTVTKSGSGDGTVTSSPGGIDCGPDCSEPYDSGTPVTLTASPAPECYFEGWSGGGCSGTNPCTVTLNTNTTVTATFYLLFTFTDDPLTLGVTPVKAIHITELRQSIDALRSHHGLGVFAYTDPTLTVGVTPIRAVHLTELRTALDGVYDALGLARPSYTDPVIVAGQTVIKGVHIEELRSAVRVVE